MKDLFYYSNTIFLLIISILFFISFYYFTINVDITDIENKAIYLNPNDTLCKESIMYYLELYNVPHADIVLKQAILETSHFSSRLCLENNNLFGLKRFSNGQYFKFDHWSESISLYKWTISYKYTDGCYYQFLKDICYAEDILYINKLKSL